MWNVYQWLDYAQQRSKRALERVLIDLADLIGGKSESKEKITKGLDDLMQKKYTNTTNPFGTQESNGPSNLERNQQNIVEAANFKIKIQKEVPSTHVTPPDSGSESGGESGGE